MRVKADWRIVRRGLVLLLLAALSPAALASHPLTVVLADWSSGEWLVGTQVSVHKTGAAAAVNEARWELDVPGCHRLILVDLFFSPNATAVALEGVGQVRFLHEVHASLWNGSREVGSARIFHEGFGHPVGLAPSEGAHELRLRLATGADVEWSARARGHLMQNETACSDPVE